LNRKVGVFLIFFFSLSAYSQSTNPVDSMLSSLKGTTKKQQANTLMAVGNYYMKIYPDSALVFTSRAFELAKEIKDDTLLCVSLNQLGNIYNTKGEYSTALPLFLRSLDFAKKYNDLNRIARINNNIGILYYNQENYEKTLEYFESTAGTFIETGDTTGAIYALNNMAGVYNTMDKKGKAMEYFNKAYSLAVASNDEASKAIVLTGIGTVHTEQGDYHLALPELIEALKIKRKGNNVATIIHSLNAVGGLYLKTEKIDSAYYYIKEAEGLAKTFGFVALEKDAYKYLSEIFEKKNQPGEALKYLKLHDEIKDSLRNDQNEKDMAEMQAKYNKVEDEKKIELLNKNDLIQQKEIERKGMQNIMLIGGVIVILLFVFLIYSRLRDSKKQNTIISEQKELVDIKNKEITDSINYAKQIQQAMLKSERHESVNLPEHFIYFKPKDIVSGDFYWEIEKNDFMYLGAVDCTGHGVPGALLTMLGTAFLNEITAGVECLSPNEILNGLRTKIISELGQSGREGENRDGMDISLIRINLKTLDAEWAGANNSFFVIGDATLDATCQTIPFGEKNEGLEVKPDKQAIGYSRNMTPFINNKIQLKKGTCIYLFTDGFVDQFGGPDGKKLKSKLLKEVLLKHKNESMSDQRAAIKETFISWKGKLEQVDDVCVIGVRV